MKLETAAEPVPEAKIESGPEIRKKIGGELEKLEIPLIEEIMEHLAVIEENSDFQDDVRMIMEGVENVLDLEDSFQLNPIEKKRLRLAIYLHDIGKAGPSTDPECRLAVIKLFSVKGIKNRERVTVGEIIQNRFSDSEALIMFGSLSTIGVTAGMTMLEFHNRHAYWTMEMLDQYSDNIDGETRLIAASHHMNKDINPYKKDINNISQVSNEAKYSILLLMAIDQYQAFRFRSGFDHAKAIESLESAMKPYNDALMSLIIKNIDQLGSSSKSLLFPKTLATQKRFKLEKAA